MMQSVQRHAFDVVVHPMVPASAIKPDHLNQIEFWPPGW